MIPILYEDNHVLVVVKPPNVPSQEDESGDPDMLTLLKRDLKERYQKPGNVFLALVHRLDRPVGGVMMFAKTSKAASRLSEEVRTRNIHKRYLAVVHGRPSPDAARLEHYLVKNNRTNTVTVTHRQDPMGKLAVLHYEWLASNGPYSLVGVTLETGRPHQIRVQLAHIGCPIFGDQRYGANMNKIGQQIALWSHQLSFTHPVKKERMSFTSPPPDVTPWNLFHLEHVQ
jgi:23S rRNA pseudouridine1911/1915/1917 synthase